MVCFHVSWTAGGIGTAAKFFEPPLFPGFQIRINHKQQLHARNWCEQTGLRGSQSLCSRSWPRIRNEHSPASTHQSLTAADVRFSEVWRWKFSLDNSFFWTRFDYTFLQCSGGNPKSCCVTHGLPGSSAFLLDRLEFNDAVRLYHFAGLVWITRDRHFIVTTKMMHAIDQSCGFSTDNIFEAIRLPKSRTWSTACALEVINFKFQWKSNVWLPNTTVSTCQYCNSRASLSVTPGGQDNVLATVVAWS